MIFQDHPLGAALAAALEGRRQDLAEHPKAKAGTSPARHTPAAARAAASFFQRDNGHLHPVAFGFAHRQRSGQLGERFGWLAGRAGGAHRLKAHAKALRIAYRRVSHDLATLP